MIGFKSISITVFLWVAVCQFICSGLVHGQQEKPEDVVIGKRFKIQSSILEEERQIRVSLPAGYQATENKYGVIYVLDGETHFALTAAMARHMDRDYLPLIVVGIENTQRTRDLTPKLFNVPPSEAPEGAGGSKNFRRFLIDELCPFIEQEYRTNDLRILVGHSFGALFVLDTLLEQPSAFSSYLALSPSLWWDEKAMIDRFNSVQRGHDMFQRHLYLSMGEEDESMNTTFEEAYWAIKKKAPSDFRWSRELFLGEDHWSVVPAATNAALKDLFRPLREASLASNVETIEELDAQFESVGQQLGVHVPLRAPAVWRLAMRTQEQQGVDPALAVLGEGIRRLPKAFNLYRMSGRMQETAGRFEAAIKTYQQGISAIEKAEVESLDWMVADMKAKIKKLQSKLSSEKNKTDCND